ncbi:helix-turn-helix domain-containing protein [Sphingosinicella rhizophila]|uniref:XRE family transcriptional regulator n=1 Tax=Sphingosinicella rhizophila TaxID=3050082 RepID=A0ABU3Q509_9SPHN|nr:XRE family transcriptional regulator [Sphingosinicella sp. GR2756]MDT9598481.1 XRE family transcriptional regulator [Sphingosinicella sp. GR2756]
MTSGNGDRARPAAQPGLILRQLRIARGLTQTDLSNRTGLPVSTVSKVELGKMALTYDKLARISEGLSVDIAQIFGAAEEAPRDEVSSHGIRSVTRSSGGGNIDTATYNHVYHATDLRHKQFIPLIAEIKARTLDEFGDLIRHKGEEYSYVLEGTVEFHSDLYMPVILEVGDSVYFDSGMGHAYLKVGDAPCRVLSICAGGDMDAVAYEARATASPEIVRRASDPAVEKNARLARAGNPPPGKASAQAITRGKSRKG